jgi:hypothetical protein
VEISSGAVLLVVTSGVYKRLINPFISAYPSIVTPLNRDNINTEIDVNAIWRENVVWIHLAQDRDQEWALMKKIMSLFIP